MSAHRAVNQDGPSEESRNASGRCGEEVEGRPWGSVPGPRSAPDRLHDALHLSAAQLVVVIQMTQEAHFVLFKFLHMGER